MNEVIKVIIFSDVLNRNAPSMYHVGYFKMKTFVFVELTGKKQYSADVKEYTLENGWNDACFCSFQ